MILELCLLVISFFLLNVFFSKCRNFPKGPLGIPLLGYLPWLWPKLHVGITKLGAKYGNIFSVNIGGESWIVLNNYEVIKKAFRRLEFAGRPRHIAVLGCLNYGIAGNEGADWVEQRQFALRTLKSFRFESKSMEAILHENANKLIEYYRSRMGAPQLLQEHVCMANLNLIWQLITGESVPIDDQECLDIYKIGKEGITDNAMNMSLYVMPWIAKMFPNMTGTARLHQARDKLREKFGSLYLKRMDKFIPGRNAVDFVDAYLQKMYECKDTPESSFYKHKGKSNFIDTLINLFFGSTDPNTAMLQFVILFLLKWPKKMEKLVKEINAVLGRRMAVGDDRGSLPYTTAVMYETFRLGSIAPGAALHKTLNDVDFEGFRIPKNTVVFPNVLQAHRDPTVWVRPDEFIPERFLNVTDRNIQCKRDEGLLTFGIGRRQCIAKNIAEIQFIISLTSLVQNFRIQAAVPLPLPELKDRLLEPLNLYVVLDPL